MTPTGRPAWLGIGAQRCGTTWFTDLLCSHPEVSLARTGGKELHWFDRFLTEPWAADAEIARYRALFDPAVRSGEFTPAYLRSLWVPPLARAACPEDVVVIVLLRDPVARFRSAMNWFFLRGKKPAREDVREFGAWTRGRGNEALWGGMYASQLRVWARSFPRERFVVVQYEKLVADPAAEVGRVWTALGLRPHTLTATREPTWNATGGASWEEPAGLREQLRVVYEAEVAGVASEWGIDRALWPDFA